MASPLRHRVGILGRFRPPTRANLELPELLLTILTLGRICIWECPNKVCTSNKRHVAKLNFVKMSTEWGYRVLYHLRGASYGRRNGSSYGMDSRYRPKKLMP